VLIAAEYDRLRKQFKKTGFGFGLVAERANSSARGCLVIKCSQIRILGQFNRNFWKSSAENKLSCRSAIQHITNVDWIYGVGAANVIRWVTRAG
jgi:hypothetical protein